jgi:hypothetical protein
MQVGLDVAESDEIEDVDGAIIEVTDCGRRKPPLVCCLHDQAGVYFPAIAPTLLQSGPQI